MNIVIQDGTLGRDPEFRFIPSGAQVANFSMAVDNGYGDKKKDPFWFNVTAWEELAEEAAKLTKGSKVRVIGRLTSRTYQKDGANRTAVEIVAETITVRKFKNDKAAQPAAVPVPPPDDIPF